MSKWIHKTSQSHLEIIDFINALHPKRDGIQGALSGKDYHVWVREGDPGNQKYVLQYPAWDTDSRQQLETLLENETVTILGFHENRVYYLEGA
ncbi:hypothetical protein MLD52_20315 [Puniceicoccaceae bacterium K14]|nr:hypothetical protein [Puniceicoccaceae bacterium K14]